jgi:hypothetical protein
MSRPESEISCQCENLFPPREIALDNLQIFETAARSLESHEPLHHVIERLAEFGMDRKV